MSYNSKYTGVEVENLLGKAGTALQEHQDISHLATKTELSKKQDTISDLATIRQGAAKGATALQTHQDISGKQDKGLKFNNVSASTWISDTTFEEYQYRCDLSCSGVTSNDYAEVIFNLIESVSGSYAPICETKTNVVSIWSKSNSSIVVPTIVITK